MPDVWNTYRTRFLVRAKQLTEPLQFTDVLGREHYGRPGDYLVESSTGLMRIAPREIFEDVYVPLINSLTAIQNHTPDSISVIPNRSVEQSGEEPYVRLGSAMRSAGPARISPQ